MSIVYLLTWMMVFLRTLGVILQLPIVAGRPIPVMMRLGLCVCIATLLAGIVPPATAIFPHQHVGSPDKTLLEIGNSEERLAHADLFISNRAHVQVFEPIAKWLAGVKL